MVALRTVCELRLFVGQGLECVGGEPSGDASSDGMGGAFNVGEGESRGGGHGVGVGASQFGQHLRGDAVEFFGRGFREGHG
jgi:hypothetical protein